MENKHTSVIVLKLPDGLHFYCGKIKFQGAFFDDWDLDITYAIIYFNKTVAKKRCGVLKLSAAQRNAKVKDYFRLSPEQQQKRITEINNHYNNLKRKQNGNS